MSDPLVFDDISSRFGLPFLFMGQAQKELSVNEAHALTDALLHCAIEGVASAPPSSPIDGTNWLVGTAATGEWAGQAGKLACRQGGNWLFVEPRDGLRILDRATGQERLYAGTWQIAVAPSEPSGGTTVDTEARAAIIQVISALRTNGILPSA